MGSLVNRKICLMAILLFTGLFITYTAYSVYAVNFWTFYPVSEHLKGTVPDKSKELYNDLEEKAEEYDTDIFLYENHGNASTDTVIKVYATGGAIDALKKCDIDNRVYKNPVTQNLSIEVSPLCDAKYIEGTPDIFYITKDIDNDEVKRFSEFFKQKYGYNDVAEASPDIGIDTVLIFFWVIVFAVLMMLAYYDVINCRKKNAVTVVLGGSTTGRRIRFVREYLLPVYTITAVYCLVAISGTFPKFGLKYLLYMIVVLSIVVVLLQSSMTAIDFKRDLSDASNIRKMLKISYCVRILVSIAGVTVLTVSGISIFKTIDLSEQRAFFEAHKDYDFYMIYSEDGYNPAQDFYNEFSSKALGYQMKAAPLRKYQDKWWNDRNPAYTNYSGKGGDCTNYASQVLHAGGAPYDKTGSYTWYPDSYSWINVAGIKNYLLNNTYTGPCGKTVSKLSELTCGDLIQIKENHTVVVYKGGTKDPYVTAHSSNYKGRFIR